MIKDAAGQDVRVNDTIWIASESGTFVKANILEVYNNYLVAMTKANSIIEIDFLEKKGIPSTNRILRA